MHEALKRYKELLRKCAHHGISKWMHILNFYKGLTSTSRTLIDASSEGALMKKNEDEAMRC